MTAALWQHEEVERVTGGSSTGPWEARGVSIDTRSLQPGDLFVALVGERFDGHQFLDHARRSGASAAIVSRPEAAPASGALPVVAVPDTLAALRDLARAARRRSAARIVAVTGSVGKTGTKEGLKKALGALGPTAASEGNFNNHYGAPLSLARLPAAAAYAVFELGMSAPGELADLARLVAPDVAVVTAIEAAHLENFNDVGEIADAKAEIFAGLQTGGTAVLNRDNPYFDRLAGHVRATVAATIRSFGRSPDADARLLAREPLADDGSAVRAALPEGEVSFTVGAPGEHYALNSVAVLAAVGALGGAVAPAAGGLAELAPPAGRGARHKLALPGGGSITVLDESYNASPAAVRAALAVLADERPGPGGRRIAVLGDMLELGPTAPERHAGLAESVTANRIDRVDSAGELMAHLHAALPAAVRGSHADDAESLAPAVQAGLRPGDIVMIKGSAGLRMSRILQALITQVDPEAPEAGG